MKFSLAAACFWFTTPVPAQDLLLDIHQGPGDPNSSTPSDMVAFNGALLMQASREGLGDELVRWDGREASLVADVLIGPDSSSPRQITPVGDKVFFVAKSAAKGRELWVSDGLSGAELVWQLVPGPQSGDYKGLTAFGDRLLFIGATGFLSPQFLYSTDGTTAGTFMINAPGVSVTGSALTNFAGRVYFSASTSGDGNELWSSDGTDLQLEMDLAPGPESSSPAEFTVLGDWLYFRVGLGVNAGLWRTDGLDFELVAGADTVQSIGSVTVGGNSLYFTGLAPDGDRELWKSDGTASGTVQLTELEPGPPGFGIENLNANANGAFFTFETDADGRELYFNNGTPGHLTLLEFQPGQLSPNLSEFAVTSAGLTFLFNLQPVNRVVFSDGTPAGTRVLTATEGKAPTSFTAIGEEVYFSGYTEATGFELFATDGTVAGTGVVADLDPVVPNASSEPSLFRDLGGALFFVATDEEHGREPWLSDGTQTGTRIVRDIAPGGSGSAPSDPVVFQDRVIFKTNPGATADRALWSTDGTEQGTQPLVDGSFQAPTGLYAGTERVYFSAVTLGEGREPWTTDGTFAGTVPLMDINPGEDSSFPGGFAQLANGTVVFTARDAEQPTGLWRTDGQVVERLADDGGLLPVVFGSGALFRGVAAETGSEPWFTDGTLAGTFPLGDLEPGEASSVPTEVTVVGERAFFLATTASEGKELWVTDGSPAGTARVIDLVPGTSSTQFGSFAAFGERLLFTSVLGVSYSLWITDGTEAGTELLLDLSSAATGTQIGVQDSLVVAGEVAWFEVNADIGTATLWQTDGTLQGTQQVLDPDPLVQTVGDKIVSKTAVGSDETLLFRAVDPLSGGELWIADGVPGGATLLADLRPGPSASNPYAFARAGDTVFFRAFDGHIGSELYSMPFAATESWLIAPYGNGCPGAGEMSPSIDGVGPAVLGGTLGLELAHAAPLAPTGLLLSTQRLAFPLGGGCNLYLGTPLQTVAVTVTNATGEANVAAPIPSAPALAGVPLHFQFAVVDAQALLGGTLSDGLEVILGV